MHNIPWNYNFALHSWNRPRSHRMKAMGSVSLEQADPWSRVPKVWKQRFGNGIHWLKRASEWGAQAAPISGFDLCCIQIKYLASWMLLWLNFSRVAILNPKQSRRICSVVKQHSSEYLEITKVRCCTIFSSKQGRENQSTCQTMPGSALTAPKLTETPEKCMSPLPQLWNRHMIQLYVEIWNCTLTDEYICVCVCMCVCVHNSSTLQLPFQFSPKVAEITLINPEFLKNILFTTASQPPKHFVHVFINVFITFCHH